MAEAAGVVLRGRFEQADEKRYTHVAFEVPPGVRALHIRYDYSERISSDPLLSGGNTLDIGLFDVRGIAPSSAGFRGWSGSNKLVFSVTETWATPPYLSGPIQSGTWNVLLGPYKVSPRGCEYRVEIAFDPRPGVGEQRPDRLSADVKSPDVRAVAQPGWLRGDLHCHTLHSDGDSWPADMLGEAVRRGLDFLGVTDHNQVGHHADYAAVQGGHLPVVLPGVEVTTYGGHWNVWGTDRWWEFREPEVAAVSRTMQEASASGALVSINHPKPFGPAWEYPDAVGNHAVEVWNGQWDRLNHVALGWWERYPLPQDARPGHAPRARVGLPDHVGLDRRRAESTGDARGVARWTRVCVARPGRPAGLSRGRAGQRPRARSRRARCGAAAHLSRWDRVFSLDWL
jgi:hypothetical protein